MATPGSRARRVTEEKLNVEKHLEAMRNRLPGKIVSQGFYDEIVETFTFPSEYLQNTRFAAGSRRQDKQGYGAGSFKIGTLQHHWHGGVGGDKSETEFIGSRRGSGRRRNVRSGRHSVGRRSARGRQLFIGARARWRSWTECSSNTG